MNIAGCRKELQGFINESKLAKCKVVVLPDFFLDRLINLNLNPLVFSKIIMDVAMRKGGSIDGIPQTDMRGGNAVNVASALSNLGADVTPIVCTSNYGLEQIKFHFKEMSIDTSHIKVNDKASITTALEFKNKGEKTNVMLRDLGSLSSFGPDDLDERDYALIEVADFVCLFNWAGTFKFGTALAQAVFGRAKVNGVGRTYFDTADPTPNKNGIPELIKTILESAKLDILSLNENEAIVYASFYEETLIAEREKVSPPELALEAARILASHFSARIDLHTTAFSATLKNKTEVVAPSFKVKALRATGAGDVWTAGNILGDKYCLSDECRLTLANAVSACYLSDPDGKHPTWTKLFQFLKDNA